jgi:hypothetical protein
VPHLPLDVVLNLLWLGISAGALFWLLRSERNRTGRTTFRARRRRLAAVCLMAVALFPTVSDSDDLFNFSLLQIPLRHGGVGNTPTEDSKEKASLHLARVLEMLEHYATARIQTFAVTLFCLIFLTACRAELFSRAVSCQSGRSPPLA